MSSDVRSISFVMYGSKGLSVLIQVEEAADGNLHFNYEVDGSAELRGLFFDFNRDGVIDNLVATGPTITNQQVGNEAVSNLKDGNEMKGTKEEFDIGMTFGSSGKGKDYTNTGEFVLSASDGTALTLDDVANVTFGARFSSKGLKLLATSPAAPDANDDAIITDEDNSTDENAPNANLISNDTDADGDQLTVVAINGNAAQVGAQFALATGALVTVNSDGTFDLDPNGAYEDLAVGEIREDSFTYRITDELVDEDNQGFDTATANITITGVNDAPIISIGVGDSELETVVETDGNLSVSGTLTVHDIDLTDVVQASVHSVVSSDNDSDVATPDNATLHGMLSLSPEAPAAILDGTEDTDTLGWTFDSANEAFNYLATDEFLTLEYTVRALDDNSAFDDQTVTITVDGTNDAPVISVDAGDSAAETVNETNGGLSIAGTLTVSDFDTTDIVDSSILSVATGGVDGDASTPSNAALKAMLSINPNAPGVLLDGTENSDTLGWAFNSAGQAFNYLADDEELILEYTISADDDNGAQDTQTVTVTVDGTNDRPIARNVSASVGEDDAAVQVNFVGSDVDSSDILSYQIISLPEDSQGHQYGEVINNNDGTFSFKPLDDFQFLDSNESRQVTFDYVAIDDSGTGTDTSVAKTATITVNGAYDAPETLSANLVFATEDQSMWATGAAYQIDWREFYGASWSESFDFTLLSKKSKTFGKVTDPITGSTIFDGITVSSPKLSVEGGMSGRVGVSPYFMLDSGSVDSTIPVNVDLTYEVQYEAGDRVRVATGYAIDNSAQFSTSSPQVTFGLDLVFEFAANADFKIGSSSLGGAKTYGLFDVSVDVDEQEAIPGVAGSGDGTDANLIEFSSVNGLSSDVISSFPTGNNGVYTIPVGESSLDLSFPYIATNGSPTSNDNHRLTSTGSDDVAVLTLDLDDILSNTVRYFPPMHYTGEKKADYKIDFPGWVNDLGVDDITKQIYKVTWDFELIDVDLIGTLTAVQDFTLDIEDLPLILTLENGDTITGFELGDEIEFDLPDWDVATLGDADGEMDYRIDVDIDALFNNYTTLDFDLDLWLRAMKANFSYDTFLTDKVTVKLFGDAASNYFAYEEKFDLINVSPLAVLFGDEDPAVSGFDIVGWNTASYLNAFDIA